MRKQLLLLLALAACRQSEASDLEIIKQVAAEHTANAPAEGNDDRRPDVISALAEASKPEGSSAIIKTESDDHLMWGSADPENLMRGAAARNLAAKFPLPVPHDLGLTLLMFKKTDASWFISYTTKSSVKEVGDLHKKAYTAKGLELDHTLSIEESAEQWLQLGGESKTIRALATIKREDQETIVLVTWDPKEERRNRF